MTRNMEPKQIQSQKRIEQAVEAIFERNESFTGQIELELHCKDGVVKDIYEIKTRRKV